MKKALGISKKIFAWLVVLFAVAMMVFTVISVTMFNRNDRSIFGYKMYIVNSDSMSATDFSAGDLIFVKETDVTKLKEGDIISFMSQNTTSFGETVTHKIRSLTTDKNGDPGFITYGTTTDTDDEVIVTYPYILGEYQGHIPYLGTFFNFMKSTTGYFLCIFIPFMLIIVYEAIKFFALLRKLKKEESDKLQAEKDKIEAERQENAKMLEELKALKAQLSGEIAAATADKGAEEAPKAEEKAAGAEEAPKAEEKTAEAEEAPKAEEKAAEAEEAPKADL